MILGTKIGTKNKNQKQWTLYMCYWVKGLETGGVLVELVRYTPVG